MNIRVSRAGTTTTPLPPGRSADLQKAVSLREAIQNPPEIAVPILLLQEAVNLIHLLQEAVVILPIQLPPEAVPPQDHLQDLRDQDTEGKLTINYSIY